MPGIRAFSAAEAAGMEAGDALNSSRADWGSLALGFRRVALDRGAPSLVFESGVLVERLVESASGDTHAA